jgi:hypothetical protein
MATPTRSGIFHIGGDLPVNRIGFAPMRRWCMNTVSDASLPLVPVSFDRDGDRYTEAGHLVEDVAGDFGFPVLIGQSSGVKPPADDGLVSIHHWLREATSAYPEQLCHPMRP